MRGQRAINRAALRLDVGGIARLTSQGASVASQLFWAIEVLAMNANAVAQVTLLLVVLALISKPLGVYIYRVMEHAPTWAERMLAPLERTLYRCCRVDASAEMSWKAYFAGLLFFNTAGALTLYCLLRLQAFLPLNPAHVGAVARIARSIRRSDSAPAPVGRATRARPRSAIWLKWPVSQRSRFSPLRQASPR